MAKLPEDRQSPLLDPKNREAVVEIVEVALELEQLYYASHAYVSAPLRHCFFRLRKALEGVWGHDLPELD